MEYLYGIHPVEEAIRAGKSRRPQYVVVSRERGARRDDRLERLLETCRTQGIRVTTEPRDQLDRLAGSDQHQGVLAALPDRKFLTVEDLLAFSPRLARGSEHDSGRGVARRFFLALDGVEDPHNLGALLRSAEGAGVDGVLLPERRSAPVTAVVAKTSAGASEHIPIARVTNLVRALEVMKKANVWVLGLDERGTPEYTDFDFRATDCVLVLGREGAGLHDLVKKTCDHLLSIPMQGAVSSLNVSVAGAVVMYESLRQRRTPVAQAKQAPKPAKPRKGLGS